MRILAIYNAEYGLRHIANLKTHKPQQWVIEAWQAPAILPPVIDYPEDFLPSSLPQADLVCSFAEQRGVAELLPDIARMTSAKSVLAPVDNEAWLPRGLARQLHAWLEMQNVACATPKPLCSLTEHDYAITRRERVTYHDPIIAEFATYFGRPELKLTIDPQALIITAIDVKRDAVCGCARFVAEKLVGISVENADIEAGLAHHHFPCLASMGKDTDFGDTLMHISGNILKDSIISQVKPYKQFLKPQ
jgi:thymidylate synthase